MDPLEILEIHITDKETGATRNYMLSESGWTNPYGIGISNVEKQEIAGIISGSPLPGVRHYKGCFSYMGRIHDMFSGAVLDDDDPNMDVYRKFLADDKKGRRKPKQPAHKRK